MTRSRHVFPRHTLCAGFAAALLLSAVSPTAASAQSSDPFREAVHASPVEARLSLRIPFGSGSRSGHGALQPGAFHYGPQLSIGIHRELSSRPAALGLPEDAGTRLGFALRSEPTLLLDGRPVAPPAASADASAGRTVVDGLAVVGGITLATAAVFLTLDVLN